MGDGWREDDIYVWMDRKTFHCANKDDLGRKGHVSTHKMEAAIENKGGGWDVNVFWVIEGYLQCFWGYFID